MIIEVGNLGFCKCRSHEICGRCGTARGATQSTTEQAGTETVVDNFDAVEVDEGDGDFCCC